MMAQVNVECMDGDDRPTILYPVDVADIMREMQSDVYRDARRVFAKEIGVDPRNVRDPDFRGFVNYLFSEWLTYDVRLVSAEEGAQERLHSEEFADWPGLGPDAKDEIITTTAFDLVATCAYGNGLLTDSQFADMVAVSCTNFVSWFWLRKAHAADGLLILEDLADGTEYEVVDGVTAARYDGAEGGSLVGRLAQVRDVWRLIATPPIVVRDPHDRREYERVRMIARLRRPDYLQLLAMLLPLNPVYRKEAGAAAGSSARRGDNAGSRHGQRQRQRRNHRNQRAQRRRDR